MDKQMNNYEDEIIIDVGAMIQALLKRAHIIVMAGILCAAMAFGVSKLMMTPQYSSTTKVLIISRQSENVVTYADLQIGTVLTGDYMALATSRTVLEEVIDELQLNMSVKALKSCLSLSEVEDTRIVTITVKHPNPEMAREIANAVRVAAGEQFEQVTSIDSVFTVEDANLPQSPSSPNVMKYTFLGGCLGAGMVIAIVICLFLMDDTIKTSQDVETYLNLGVLASIPLQDDEKRKVNPKLLKPQKKNRWKRKR